MEKRLILAFVLSFVVLIGWFRLFGPREHQELPKKEEIVDREAPREMLEFPKTPALTHPTPTQVPGELAPRAIPKIDEKEIEVDTPLYRAVFSNVGPTIRSFKLKKYYHNIDPDSPLIELVSLEEGMGDFLRIDFNKPFAAQDERIIYQVDQQAIRLGPESSHKDLVFRSITENGLSKNHTYRFYPDQYRIDVTIDVINRSGGAVKGTFTANLRALPPKEKKSYYSYVGLVALVDDDVEKVKIKKTSEEKVFNGQVDWIAYEDDYFLSAVIPEWSSEGVFEGRLLLSGLLEGTYLQPSVSLNPYQQVSSRYTLYLGPRDLGILKQLERDLHRIVNFGWTDIIAKPILYALRFLNQYINNYGVSIILITILIKILFWPLTHKSYMSMKEMQKLQPRMVKIKEKYKNNREQMNKEVMALYKTYKVNPMSGCLPMIIQIPVFFALFRILGNSIELRHAPFMFWIKDLSAPDRLFNFPFEIPFMSPPWGIPVLTLLMGGSMFIQQKMTPTPGDPTQAKIMMFLPIIFTVMFINFPSGLVLYWLINNILSIGQQYRIHRRPA